MADEDPIGGETPEEEPDTHKYGVRAAVEVRLGLLGQTPASDLISTALNSADVYVDNQLRKARLPVPTTAPYIGDLVEAATLYAVAEALQPLFNLGEGYSQNVSYYLNRSRELLEDYIATEIETRMLEEDHPYSSSKTPRSIGGPVDKWL